MSKDRRQTHDYGEISQIDEPTAQEALDDAKVFISTVESYLHSASYL